MDKEEGLEGLIDETGNPIKNLGGYSLGEPEHETNKKWLYRGRHPRLGIEVCIKVFKPRTDELDSFRGEIGNLKGFHHQNLEQIFDAGMDKGYHYIVSRWIEGKSLKELIDEGVSFSQKRGLEIGDSVLESLDFADDKGCPHTDVKPANIMLEKDGEDSKPSSGTVQVIDFGIWPSDPTRNHVSGTAGVLRALLDSRENPKQRIPRGLERILGKAEIIGNEGYQTPGEFRDALEDFRRDVKKRIGRRNFLKVTGSVCLGSVPTIYGINRYMEYSRTHHKLEDIIHEIQLTSDFNLSLNENLLHELYMLKIVPLIETVPKDQFPLKVSDLGKYQTAPNSYNDQGEWIRVIGLGYLLTGDESYLTEAIERNRFLEITRDGNGNLTEMDEQGINLTRIVRANTFLINLIEQSVLEEKDHNYRDIKNDLNSELREVVNIFIENKYREDLGGYFIMSSTIDENLPNRSGRGVIRSGAINILEGLWKFIDESLEDKLFNHIRLSNRYLFREDGSVIDAVLIDKVTGNFIESNIFGWLRGDFEPTESTKSCYNWTLMDLLIGMEHAYPYLNDEDKQVTANNIRRSLDFYMNNFNLLRERGFFRERVALPIDFYDIRLQNKKTWSEIKINNYPLVLSLRVLSDAIDIIKDNEFRSRVTEILTYTAINLTRCISTSKDIQGIIEDASDTELHLGDDTPSHYMYADANYLEYLHHLLKNRERLV